MVANHDVLRLVRRHDLERLTRIRKRAKLKIRMDLWLLCYFRLVRLSRDSSYRYRQNESHSYFIAGVTTGILTQTEEFAESEPRTEFQSRPSPPGFPSRAAR